MATPNIVNVATINAKNATGAVTTSNHLHWGRNNDATYGAQGSTYFDECRIEVETYSELISEQCLTSYEYFLLQILDLPLFQ